MTNSTTTRPTLRFLPTAWAKLLYLRDAGPTEIGGFGISAPDDLLLVEDVALVEQQCTDTSVRFVDAAVADFFDRQVDAGRRPASFGRLWIHTHPGHSPQPSQTDEETFARGFGQTDWAVMLIVDRASQTYARLRYHVGPGGDLLVPVAVDYSRAFGGTDREYWQAEYDQCVRPVAVEDRRPSPPTSRPRANARRQSSPWPDTWYDDLDRVHTPTPEVNADDWYEF